MDVQLYYVKTCHMFLSKQTEKLILNVIKIAKTEKRYVNMSMGFLNL